MFCTFTHDIVTSCKNAFVNVHASTGWTCCISNFCSKMQHLVRKRHWCVVDVTKRFDSCMSCFVCPRSCWVFKYNFYSAFLCIAGTACSKSWGPYCTSSSKVSVNRKQHGKCVFSTAGDDEAEMLVSKKVAVCDTFPEKRNAGPRKFVVHYYTVPYTSVWTLN